MNYFELFGIPISLQPDTALVKKQFYTLSRRYHPDFFSQADEATQADALEKSALVNKAYKVLQNPDETLQYVLTLKGLLPEEEKYQLPPAFLMEVMELNEQLVEARMEGDTAQLAALEQNIVHLKIGIYEPVEQIVARYQEGITTEEELLQVKAYYYKKKYLNRILAGLK